VLIFFTVPTNAKTLKALEKVDTVFIHETATIPNIDGIGDDTCWKDQQWYGINNVWINYGEVIDPTDYYGRFKVVWSKKENLLYFLVEVTDDYAIGGYLSNPTYAIYNYDIIEVFIDENRSKGPNIVYGPGGIVYQDAFAYHIYIDFPSVGEVNKTPIIEDVGPGPRNQNIPEFAIRGAENFYTREFSLKVYDSTFDASNPELSRAQLKGGKIMGLSLAYCDNENDDGQRDNFFGSVWVPADKYNSHWLEADDFGPAKLIASQTPNNITQSQYTKKPKLYPNPVSDYLTIESENSYKYVQIVDISGKIMNCEISFSENKTLIKTSNLKQGVYFVQMYNDTGRVFNNKIVKD